MKKSHRNIVFLIIGVALSAAVHARDNASVNVVSDAEMHKPAAVVEQSSARAGQGYVEIEELPAIQEWLKVPSGATMFELARQHKTGDVSVGRVVVAMYRINATKFDGGNMNRIRAGKTLRLPYDDEVLGVTQFEAEKEISAQVAAWKTSLQKSESVGSR